MEILESLLTTKLTACVLQYVVVCCIMLQCVEVCCSVLQCVAVYLLPNLLVEKSCPEIYKKIST